MISRTLEDGSGSRTSRRVRDHHPDERRFTLGVRAGGTAIMTLENGLTGRVPSAFMKKVCDRRVLRIVTRTGLE
jgi:hypothetical protein